MSEKHTQKFSKLLPAEYQSHFSVVAHMMDKASILWAILLSPLIWAFMNKHYVVAFDSARRQLYLFRISMGFFGPGKATGFEALALSDLQDLNYREHILTGTLSFRRSDGQRVKLFVPVPSKKNARRIHEMIQLKS